MLPHPTPENHDFDKLEYTLYEWLLLQLQLNWLIGFGKEDFFLYIPIKQLIVNRLNEFRLAYGMHMKWSSSVSRSKEDVKNFITDMHNEEK